MLCTDGSPISAFIPSEPELVREWGAYESDLRSLPDVGDDPFKGFPQRLCTLFLKAATNLGYSASAVSWCHLICPTSRTQAWITLPLQSLGVISGLAALELSTTCSTHASQEQEAILAYTASAVPWDIPPVSVS